MLQQFLQAECVAAVFYTLNGFTDTEERHSTEGVNRVVITIVLTFNS